MKQRGFVIPPFVLQFLPYILAAIAIAAALAWLHRSVKESGRAEIRAEWAEANRKEKERQERERIVRNDITDKQEAAHATQYADLDRRYRAALIGVREQPGSNREAAPLSSAAGLAQCPDGQANLARGLAALEEGVLGLLERGDRAIVRTETCRAWLAEQMKVDVR